MSACQSLSGSPVSLVNDFSAVPSNSPSPATPSLNDAHSSPTLDENSTSEQAGFLSASALAPLPKKQRKLTPAEKLAKEKQKEAEKVAKEKQKETEKAAKEALKKQKEVEKAAKHQAAEEARKQKEAEKAQKEAEKAQKDAEKATKAQEKAEKKKQKEEEERKARELKEKAARAQPSIASFFGKTPGVSPTLIKNTSTQPTQGNPTQSNSASGTPTNPQSAPQTEYERLFKPFFVKANVIMAENCFAMDKAAQESKSRNLDSWVKNHQDGVFPIVMPFRPLESFCLPARPGIRGKKHPSVKKLLSELFGHSGETSTSPIDLTKSQRISADAVKDVLRTIPYKFIGFKSDVRPPYRGTITSETSETLQRLAKRPTSKMLSQLNYDYDSEAEWFDDDEGDDLEDADDSDDDIDADEDMAEFLDDSEESGISRIAYGNDMKPESTSICFEDANHQGPLPMMKRHGLELILRKLLFGIHLPHWHAVTYKAQ